MEINYKGAVLSHNDVDDIVTMSAANYAIENLIKHNYYEDVLPEKDVSYLKDLCETDCSCVPDRQSLEWYKWHDNIELLSELSYAIFVPCYHTRYYCSEGSMKYDERELIKKWSEHRQYLSEIGDKIVQAVVMACHPVLPSERNK